MLRARGTISAVAVAVRNENVRRVELAWGAAIAAEWRIKGLDRATVPVDQLDLIERVPMFAPLSIAAKERIAAKLVPVSVVAGECVIRAGEVGDRFYIVADGEFDIDVADTTPLRARPTTSARSGCCVISPAPRRSPPPSTRTCTRCSATTSSRP